MTKTSRRKPALGMARWWPTLTKVFLAAFVAVGCSSNPAPTPDVARTANSAQAPDVAQAPVLVLTGGEIVTLDPASPTATALQIKDGQIAGVGTSDLSAAQRPGQNVIQLGGAVVAPALVDHHVHLFNIGLTLLNDRHQGRMLMDLSGVPSLDEVAKRIRERAAKAGSGEWILGIGWSQKSWGTQVLPDRAVLDAAAPNHPVYLARTDGHAGWLNAKALALAGITATTPDPEGGVIVRDKKRAPTGILLERANELVLPLVPPLSDDDVMTTFRLAADALAARGVVAVYDAGYLPTPGVVALNANFDRFLTLLRRTDAATPLPLQINLMIPAPSPVADAVIAGKDTNRVLSPRIRITHIKLFADGALGSRSAALTHPYADDAHAHGVPRMQTKDMTDLTTRAVDAGLGVAIHAIGDEAVKRALDACEAVIAAHPGLDPTRLRIEHFSYAREEDFARAVRLGVVLAIQSSFNAAVNESPTFGGMRVGEANDPRVYAWGRLYRMGARLAESSDYFARPGPPLASYAAALSLHNSIGEGRPDAEARLLVYRMQATWFPPSGGPVAAVIKKGASANLVVLNGNPLTVPRDKLSSVEVLATLHRGRVVWASEGFRAKMKAGSSE